MWGVGGARVKEEMERAAEMRHLAELVCWLELVQGMWVMELGRAGLARPGREQVQGWLVVWFRVPG